MLKDRAIILLSGGLDSATCLWWARRRGWDLYTLTVNYYQRHQKEIAAARSLADAAGVREHRVLELPNLMDLEDLRRQGGELNRTLLGKPKSYVPARNTIFYALGASWAEVLGARRLVGGHHLSDFGLYPDSNPLYFSALDRVLKLGTFQGRGGGMKVTLPLRAKSKVDVVRMALDLHVPLRLTWSCYEGRERSCGRCEACQKRRAAFEEVGVQDPVSYE